MVFRRICIKIELCHWSTNMAALTSLVIDFFGISWSISNSNRGVYTITADVQMCMCLYVKNTIMVPIKIKVPIKKKSSLVVSVFKVGTCRMTFLKASTDCFSVTLGSVSMQRRFWVKHVNQKWGLFHFKAPWCYQICIPKCLDYYRSETICQNIRAKPLSKVEKRPLLQGVINSVIEQSKAKLCVPKIICTFFNSAFLISL